MKIKQLFPHVGNFVTYYPGFIDIAGSVTATVLLCHLLYWHDKARDPELGVYKLLGDLAQETGMTENELNTARAVLKSKGFLTETYFRLQHKMYYKLQLEAVQKAWAEFTNGKS